MKYFVLFAVENMIHNPIYLGCFADAMDRKLKGYFNVDALLTPDKCVRECKSRNFLYAGLEAKWVCFIGCSGWWCADWEWKEMCDVSRCKVGTSLYYEVVDKLHP